MCINEAEFSDLDLQRGQNVRIYIGRLARGVTARCRARRRGGPAVALDWSKQRGATSFRSNPIGRRNRRVKFYQSGGGELQIGLRVFNFLKFSGLVSLALPRLATARQDRTLNIKTDTTQLPQCDAEAKLYLATDVLAR